MPLQPHCYRAATASQGPCSTLSLLAHERRQHRRKERDMSVSRIGRAGAAAEVLTPGIDKRRSGASVWVLAIVAVAAVITAGAWLVVSNTGTTQSG